MARSHPTPSAAPLRRPDDRARQTITTSPTASLITYEGTHGIGRRDPRALHEALAGCLAQFGYGAEPTQAWLVLNLEADDDPALLSAYDELVGEYGPYPKKITGNRTDDRELRAFLWQLPARDAPSIDAAITRVSTLRARGGLLDKRATVKLKWSFRFRDPDTRELLPGQDTLPRLDRFPGGRGDSSSAMLNLGATSSLDLWLLFPFAEADDRFRAYVSRLEAALPATLSPKGWRQWRLTRAGTWKATKLELA